MKLGVSREANRGTLCRASPSVCEWCGVLVVCVLCVVFGPYRRYCDEHYFLSRAVFRSSKVGSWMVWEKGGAAAGPVKVFVLLHEMMEQIVKVVAFSELQVVERIQEQWCANCAEDRGDSCGGRHYALATSSSSPRCTFCLCLRFSPSTECCVQLHNRDGLSQCKLCRKPRCDAVTGVVVGGCRHARCCADKCMVESVQETVEVRQLQFGQVVDVLVVQVVQVSQVQVVEETAR